MNIQSVLFVLRLVDSAKTEKLKIFQRVWIRPSQKKTAFEKNNIFAKVYKQTKKDNNYSTSLQIFYLGLIVQYSQFEKFLTSKFFEHFRIKLLKNYFKINY